jgi:CheY-like chemotaxis protein
MPDCRFPEAGLIIFIRGLPTAMETILVVDDDPMVLATCQRMLTLGGYAVLASSGGTDALLR